MGRMSISDRVATFNVRPCEQTCYGILISLSEGYPPVGARLHTRYAPVRRSPSEYCYSMLPLDLHVLGLSLAFILSQDQTLRCMIDFVYLPFETSTSPDSNLLSRLLLKVSLSASLPIFQRTCLSLFQSLASGEFRGAKLGAFPETTKTFLKFFFRNFHKRRDVHPPQVLSVLAPLAPLR